jgi:aminoglycoside phosphotransferase (APT) family kinase protein
MHADEVPSDVHLVRRLLALQFPQWADLPIAHVPSSGTVNALYRLGDDMVMRIPRMAWGQGMGEELEWLPKLTPLLPAEVPVPIAVGEPAEGYPWAWGVYPWLEGEIPEVERFAGSVALALDLAGFVQALHAADLPGGPPAGRGSSLSPFNEATRAALVSLEGVIDTEAATEAWDEALEVHEWEGAPAWVHGDLMPGNLLVRDGRLAAVIDWGGFGVGDPAVDLAVAWNLLSGDARDAFRATLAVDDATWLRGRGWALWTGIVALPYYVETNPVLAANARYRIDQVLAEWERR